ncbi:MAG: putative DNA binding domain-containing protein [Victivallales bacterium]|nr:putative DNA binding domain-containing protein [Victivallales bacterium]
MKINGQNESEFQEFKASLSEMDKGIVSLTAMLNKNGKGKVYFGVADDGEVLGLKGTLGRETVKKIGTRVAESVKPPLVPRIYFEEHGEETIIVLEAEGYNKPYSASGEYRIRVGSEDRKIDPELLGELFFSNPAMMAANAEASTQELTFDELTRLYAAKGLTIDNATFARNMGLLTRNGSYNYLAEILSDSNNCSIKVVRFQGKDKQEMVSRNEYGYKCLLVAMRQAFDYVSALNEVRVNLHSGMERAETRLFNQDCLDEAWTNACLHNRWIRNVPPVIYIFSDRLEVVSTGGLPPDFTSEEFFAGVSRPINLPLQKIMGQLGMVEQTGHGVPKIVGVYGREAFELADNHITVRLPFAFEPAMARMGTDGLTKSQAAVLKAMRENPLYKLEELAAMVGLGKARVSQVIAELKSLGRLERVGGKKGGYWKVIPSPKSN